MEKSGSVFVGKRKTLKRKILILISVSIIYPITVFFICFFSLSPVTLPIIEWYHTAIIAAVIPEIFIINSLYKTWKEDTALRLVKPKSYEKGIKIALAIMSVALCIAFSYLYAQSMIRVGPSGEKVTMPQYGDISYLSLAILCAIGPMGFYEYFRFKRIDRMEEKFPDFLRDLAEYWRGGLSMSAAITALAKTEYGALTKEVKKMATQISWGTAFQEVLKMFSERIRTRLIARSVSLIDEANRAGGRISDILVTASNDSREIKWLQVERKKGTAVYVIIVYVGFFVYLGIVGVLAGIFLPAVGGATKGISSGTSLGGASISSIDVPFMCFIFFASALIQAIGSGIVGGLMGEGKIVAGLKHSFIMVLISWLVFAGGIYPIAVDLAQPTSSVEPMAYWHTSPTFDIKVSASDKMPGTGMGLVELFYSYSADKIVWSNWTFYDKDDESPWEFKFDSKTARGDGYYEFYSTATDVAGNKEDRPATADARCVVDTTPPTTTITINGPSQYWQTGNVTVTFTANTSDTYAGINSTTLYYRYRVNNDTEFGSWISLGTYNVSNITSPLHSAIHQWNFDWANGEGIYQFKAESVDNVSNKEQKDFDMELGHAV